mmetsp:Transcript_11972/g.13611  ORF Transcript_11972/g.13611 Transcript_11972/m.13611 type:complete len:189 (-) Transcript_11972:60-626(-)
MLKIVSLQNKALNHPWFGLITEIKIQSAIEEEEKIDPKILEKLKSYKSVHLFKKAILNVLVKMLKPKETNKFASAFNRLDKDQTGVITFKEFSAALKKSDKKLTNDHAKSIIKELDFANNSKINYSEFMSACIDLEEVLKDEDRTQALFNQFDTNGSGFITSKDIKKALGSMGRKISSSEIDDVMLRY